jgi:small neutral amino acid transporter SnatA (MarC family)
MKNKLRKIGTRIFGLCWCIVAVAFIVSVIINIEQQNTVSIVILTSLAALCYWLGKYCLKEANKIK